MSCKSADESKFRRRYTISEELNDSYVPDIPAYASRRFPRDMFRSTADGSDSDDDTPVPTLNLNDKNEEAMQWRIEAMRLSQRIMELELENARLRSQQSKIRSGPPMPSSPVPLNVKQAAAASHRTRSRRKEIKHTSSEVIRPIEKQQSMRHSWSVNRMQDLVSKYSTDATQPVREMISSAQNDLTQRPSMRNIPPPPPPAPPAEDIRQTLPHSFGSDLKPTPVIRKEKASDVKFWVGTWNMGAVDPFTDSHGIMDEQTTSLMLQPFVSHGYDVYVIGIQEGVSESIYHAIEAYLNRNEYGDRYQRIALKNSDFLLPDNTQSADAIVDSVRGRGDGAFMGTKFTGIAVFASLNVNPRVELIRSSVHKFNITSGSKGGVAVALRINYATIVFVNCHLDARNDANRREQIRQLNNQLGKSMGHNCFELLEQFHHVVWMGDLNYRIHTLDGYTVLHMLGEDRNEELHDKFDGLLADRENGVFRNFIEPNKWPDFYPTYKKFEHRGVIDTNHPSWPTSVYRVKYKEPFYKGGQVKARVPGWCDRILVHSMNSSRTQFSPEQILHPRDSTRLIDHYRSVNDGVGMDISDHSPVCCTFILAARDPDRTLTNVRRSMSLMTDSKILTKLGPVVSTVLRVFNLSIQWGSNSVVPKKARIVAPLVAEDFLKQCDSLGERTAGSNGIYSISMNAIITHVQPIENLHFLIWIRHEGLVGHCVATLQASPQQVLRYRQNLMFNSMPLLVAGEQVQVTFSLRAKVFSK